ncbi:MAG: ChbG/HpnK family deacetylase [Chloroflexota bacterium]|nr:MAG: ChbG/HpnK family deacetylase [Chloroflexota bacterium]
MTFSRKSKSNRLLGYPDDARLLIINADDFGICHAANEATLTALKEGVVTSTSLMVPCPWGLHAMRLLMENSAIDFGVHLTAICDMDDYKWRPIISKEKVPTLIDESGYFYSLERLPDFLARARVDELELEFRAQIEAVLAARLKPTHLDWHCMHDGGRQDIFEMTFGLAKEYGLAMRVSGPLFIERLQSQGFPTDDHDLMDSYDLDIEAKSGRYAHMLRELPVGLSEWAVHPALGNAELQAIEPGSWQVRQTDFDFVMSQEAQDILKAEGIILLDYQALQSIWIEAIGRIPK